MLKSIHSSLRSEKYVLNFFIKTTNLEVFSLNFISYKLSRNGDETNVFKPPCSTQLKPKKPRLERIRRNQIVGYQQGWKHFTYQTGYSIWMHPDYIRKKTMLSVSSVQCQFNIQTINMFIFRRTNLTINLIQYVFSIYLQQLVIIYITNTLNHAFRSAFEDSQLEQSLLQIRVKQFNQDYSGYERW